MEHMIKDQLRERQSITARGGLNQRQEFHGINFVAQKKMRIDVKGS
jgi:hypothetical protein